MLSRLPEMIISISSLFTSMNKTVLALEEVIDKIQYSFRVPVSKQEVEKSVRWLQTTGWLKVETTVRDMVRLDRSRKCKDVIEQVKQIKSSLNN